MIFLSSIKQIFELCSLISFITFLSPLSFSLCHLFIFSIFGLLFLPLAFLFSLTDYLPFFLPSVTIFFLNSLKSFKSSFSSLSFFFAYWGDICILFFFPFIPKRLPLFSTITSFLFFFSFHSFFSQQRFWQVLFMFSHLFFIYLSFNTQLPLYHTYLVCFFLTFSFTPLNIFCFCHFFNPFHLSQLTLIPLYLRSSPLLILNILWVSFDTVFFSVKSHQIIKKLLYSNKYAIYQNDCHLNNSLLLKTNQCSGRIAHCLS